MDHDPNIHHISEKHGFFEELTCKTPSDFKFTLAYLDQFCQKIKICEILNFREDHFTPYGIMRIYVLFLKSSLAKPLNTYIFYAK